MSKRPSKTAPGPTSAEVLNEARLTDDDSEHLRDNARLEETVAANQSAAEFLRAVLADTTLSEEQLEAAGHKILTALAIRRLDAKTFLQLRAARTEARFERQRLALREREAARDDATHELARQKFQRDTCDLFLKWSEDLRAQEIAVGTGDNSAKIEALGQLMFGETWRDPVPQMSATESVSTLPVQVHAG